MKNRHGTKWTGEDVLNILSNPVYLGLGPYPSVTNIDEFVGVGRNLIEEVGAEKYLRSLALNLIQYLGNERFK